MMEENLHFFFWMVKIIISQYFIHQKYSYYLIYLALKSERAIAFQLPTSVIVKMHSLYSRIFSLQQKDISMQIIYLPIVMVFCLSSIYQDCFSQQFIQQEIRISQHIKSTSIKRIKPLKITVKQRRSDLKIPQYLYDLNDFENLEIKMKNRKLYEAIQKMVDERKCIVYSKQHEKTNFASDYCREQLIKKKLISRDPKIKMNKLMKNFQQLQTYVNVDQLIECLNEINREQCCLHNEQKFCHEQEERIEKKRYDSESQSLNMEEVNQRLKRYYHIRNRQEREKIESLMPYLENISTIRKERLKNNQNSYLLSLYDDLSHEKNTVLENVEGDNFWSQNKCEEGQKQMMQQIALKSERNIANPTNEIKKFELLNLAATYLQIILEKNYRKKWKSGIKGNQSSTFSQGPKTASTFIKSSTKRDSLNATANTMFLTQKVAKSETTRSVKKHSRNKTATKLFRSQNTTPKNIAIKRINAFLTQLDNNEVLMKNASKREYSELSNMKKAMENDFLKYEPVIVDDDMNCISEMVRKQK